MTEPDLKPCPFCTEGKTVSTYFDPEQGDKWGYASCDACGARGPEVRTNYDRDDNAPWRAEAIAAWNRRALTVTPHDPAKVQALVAALQPFASCADELDHETRETGREYTDDEWAKFRLLVSDYRQARAALAAMKEG